MMSAVVFLTIGGLGFILAYLLRPHAKVNEGDRRFKTYVSALMTAVDGLYQFSVDVCSDRQTDSVLDQVEGLGVVLQDVSARNGNPLLTFVVLHDLVKCYRKLGNGLTLSGRWEGLALGIAVTRFWDFGDFRQGQWFDRRAVAQVLPVANKLVRAIDGMKVEGYDDQLLFCMIFNRESASPQLARRYANLVRRWAMLVAQADGVISKEEKLWLAELTRLGEETQPQDRNRQESSEAKSEELLKELIGLEPVKRQVEDLASLVKIQSVRKKNGMKVAPMSYHCIFTGNPGTGKTTVARIVAGIYRDLGVLKKGQLIETDRSGLVAEYVGQTAVKTNKIIDTALDGVLFIDEAYMLANGSTNDFGAEAIATLLKRMEDERDRLVVILAGYSGEMESFVASNPGLRSRFSRTIEFPDYSVEELEEIFLKDAEKSQYVLTDGARRILHERLAEVVANHDRDFGNGRFVRNLFERVVERQASRLADSEEALSAEVLAQLTTADFA